MSKRKYRVYLDNCCFNRPYDNQDDIKIKIESLAKLFVQDAIKNKQIELIWSYILKFENDQNPYLDKQIAIEKWEELSVTRVVENDEILKNAESISSLGLKSLDALHIACAISEKCDYFLTTDRGILKKSELINSIILINPIEFVSILEEL
ncbi:PIN domain-containing protein [Leptospira vanthielii]|uniref:PIN domain-containing protein n=1 Tax=Leptospira vanthielii TaxID=293085 RepID=A0ABY2NQ97_9LEPT|nr:PIN domain-containing protein [Leptospira vanthielii]MDF3821871.1 PIN domain-containing protein [Leptospira sp. 96542]TGM58478.1 PIN domain-containing protein [Leptospira vanthielii]